MHEQNIQTYTFENGLTLVVEPMQAVRSAAFSLLVPAGSVFDGVGKNGTAAILCDLVTRGAGPRDSRQLSADLDNLGVQRSENVGCSHVGFSGATIAENLCDALSLYADIVQRPSLEEDEFFAAKAGVEQSLRSLEDEPRQKVIVELRRRCYETPWSWPNDGDLKDLEAIDSNAVRVHHETYFRPNGAILGVAGKVDVDELRTAAEELFGSWSAKPEPRFETGPRGPRLDQISHDSTQMHIGIAYKAVPYGDPDYYAAWAAVSVLSGGMSSRLFTEVRERRGLCYAVYATLSSLPHDGRVLCYAGTTVERAQETLDVTVGELSRLGDGISDEELVRCKARAKSALIMQQESTMSRASSISRDWYFLGRVRTLSEVHEKIDSLTVPGVLDYVHRYPAGEFTILTIGPNPLQAPDVAQECPG